MRRINKARIKKYLVRFSAVALIVVAIGYLSAWLSLTQCLAMTRQSLADSKLNRFNFAGEPISYRQVDIEAKVTLPFFVETYTWVPLGMHATYYEYKYFTFFGFVIQRSFLRSNIV